MFAAAAASAAAVVVAAVVIIVIVVVVVVAGGQSNLILINEANPDLRETVALASNVRISCLAVSSAGQIWAGGSRNDSVYIVDGQTRQLVDNVPLPMASTGVSGIYSLMAVGDKVSWCGCVYMSTCLSVFNPLSADDKHYVTKMCAPHR